MAQREKDMSELLDKERRLMTGSEPLDGNGRGGSGGADGSAELASFRKKKAKTVAKTHVMKKWSEKEGGWVLLRVRVRVVCVSCACLSYGKEEPQFCRFPRSPIPLDFHAMYIFVFWKSIWIISIYPCNQ